MIDKRVLQLVVEEESSVDIFQMLSHHRLDHKPGISNQVL